VRIAYNYLQGASTPGYEDSKIWTPSPAVANRPLQLEHVTKRTCCESIKVRLTAVAAGVQATRLTTGSLAVVTSGSNWNATLAARTGNNRVIGALGNNVVIAVSFESGSPPLVDLRDDFNWDSATGIWFPAVGSVGVRVVGAATVASIEAAIIAGSTLVTVTVADPAPTKTINAIMFGAIAAGQFSGGTFVGPTGEGLKLTSLGLDVGTEPGLYRRLPAAQEQ